MFEDVNLEDHQDHDPALCDFARIFLTQRYVQGINIIPTLELLTNEQIVQIGITSVMFSAIDAVEPIYAEYGISMAQLFDFSEYLRHYLMDTRVNDLGMKFVANTDNVSLN